jgi:hypothetical protein
MTKKITISELELIGLIEKSIQNKLEEQEEDMLVGDLEVMDEPMMGFEDEMEDEEDEDEELEELLSPEEILELTAEQIAQLQDRTQYMEELNADILEFMESLMSELGDSPEDVRKFRNSRRILNQLQTRSGREIFWLKSRRLT